MGDMLRSVIGHGRCVPICYRLYEMGKRTAGVSTLRP